MKTNPLNNSGQQPYFTLYAGFLVLSKAYDLKTLEKEKEINSSWQSSFDDLGRGLRETTFVVLDLETSGGSPAIGSVITEIGAFKVRSGAVVGQFHSLINIGQPLPPFITVLTGITDAMLIQAPPISEVFPALLEFLGSENETVFVAQNAPFDLGFLKSTSKTLGYVWPNFPVIDTARIARHVLTREEAPNVKLSTLAKIFGAGTSPNHRALDDARATVDVLHGIIARLGNMGVTTLEDLASFNNRTTDSQRKKRILAQSIPSTSGVYIFRANDGSALYVGTSKNLRNRVRSYFTASETRRRIREMIELVDRIDVIVCATNIEAQVRELRLIEKNDPPFNRRSRKQSKALWVNLTKENYPRLSIVRGCKNLSDERGWMGPFHNIESAQLAIDALHEVLPLRQCSLKITQKSISKNSPCVLFEMKRCNAPCIGAESYSNYSIITSTALYLMNSDPSEVHETLTARMKKLALEERFEEATEIRNRLSSFIDATSRSQRIRAITRIPQIITAFPSEYGDGYEFLCIRFGRLAGSARSSRGVSASQTLSALVQTSEIVINDGAVLPASSYEEVEKILNYVERDGIRLVDIDGDWVSPINGASKYRSQWRELSSTYDDDNFWLSSTHRSSR